MLGQLVEAALDLYPRASGPGDEVQLAQTSNPSPDLRRFLEKDFYRFNARTEDGPTLWPVVETAYVFPANLGPNTAPGGLTENRFEQTITIELRTRTTEAVQVPANLAQVPSEPGTSAEDRCDERSSQVSDQHQLHDRQVIPQLPHLMPRPVPRPERPAASPLVCRHLDDAVEKTAPLPVQKQGALEVPAVKAAADTLRNPREPPSANFPPLARVPVVFGSCGYCHRMPSYAILLPCRHQVACRKCAPKVGLCSECARFVKDFVRGSKL